MMRANLLGFRLMVMTVTVFTLVVQLWGREYYVSIKDGDNANDGSKEHPFRDVSWATARLQPGNTLIIRGGRYHDCIGPWKLEGKRR
ncbi:MAG: hypothetical protein D6820_06115, partial [Lentisphaerae bacterium]